jgi:ketosteroid isomerase-like protein
VENEIHAATTSLVTALERADVAAAAAVYADDARLLASSAELIQGRAEIEAYWRAGIDLGLCGLSFESGLLKAIDPGVLELGRYAVAVRSVPAAPAVERGAYLVLHTQARDGSWQRAVEVFNPDEPEPARRKHEKEEQ